jgi:3-hydroxyisobutyrate dehydrogenase-like beta-hydroxyacid dehydrogenase
MGSAMARDVPRRDRVPLRWAHKDVRLALAAAGEGKSHLPVLTKIAATWADALSDFGADDLSAVYLTLRR